LYSVTEEEIDVLALNYKRCAERQLLGFFCMGSELLWVVQQTGKKDHLRMVTIVYWDNKRKEFKLLFRDGNDFWACGVVVDAAIERHRLYGTKDRELADKEEWNDRVYDTIQGYSKFCVRFVGPRLPCLANVVETVVTPSCDITTNTVVHQRSPGDSNVTEPVVFAHDTVGGVIKQVPKPTVVGTQTDKNKTLQAIIQEKIAKEKLAGKKTSADTILPNSDLPITMQERMSKEKLAGKKNSADTTLPKSDLAITLQEKIAKEKLAGKKTSADTTLPKSDLPITMQEKIAQDKPAGKTTSADTTLLKSDLAITNDLTTKNAVAVTQTSAEVTGMQQGSYPKQDISKSVDFLRQYGHGRGFYYSGQELPETLPIFYADPTKQSDNLPAFSGGTPYCRWDEGRVMCFLLPKDDDTTETPRVVNVYGVVVGSVSWNCTYGTCLMQSGR
jgi:hypothetical protein